jgi:Xaa-Pro aminopeptidase
MSGAFDVASARLRADAGRARVVAVRDELEARDLDVLLVCGSGRHHFIGANLAWWLSGLRQMARDLVVALPRAGDPVLVVAPRWDAVRAAQRSWIDDIVAVDDVAAALGDLVARRGWRGARAAVAGRDAASAAVAGALSTAFATAPADADNAVLAVASRHDAWSLACVERAVAIAVDGYEHLRAVAEAGMPEYQLAAEADAHMRALGADDNFLLVSASQHNRAVHAPTDRVLAEGDVILGEISPSVDGQFAQICRSTVLGEPTVDQMRCYEVLREAYTAGLTRVAPGVAVRDVAAAIDEIITAAGYGEFAKPPYMRTRGHATGLAPLVPADVSSRSDVVLEPGMAFVLHPNQYFPDVGYLLCGDHVVVEKHGARALAPEAATLSVAGAGVLA